MAARLAHELPLFSGGLSPLANRELSIMIKNAISMNRRSVLATGAGGIFALAAPALITRPAFAMTPLKMQIDWKYNVQFAGLFMAQEAGLYAKEKLDVAIAEWTDTIDPVASAADATDTLSCSEQNIVVRAQADGKPVKAIAAMFQASPYGLMTIPDKPLETLASLKGSKVGVHDDGVKIMALVKGVNNYTDTDIMVENVPYANKFDKVISGEFAAVQCYVVDEPLGVEATYKLKPNVLRLAEYGFRSAAQVIMASDKMLSEKPEEVKAFLRATFDGWRLALSDIPAAAKIVAEKYAIKDSKYTDVAYQTASLTLIKEYVELGVTPETIGVINVENWRAASELMAKYGIVATLPDMATSVAPEFMAA
jgi:NitT/TauT family transport system substrate-binding protein